MNLYAVEKSDTVTVRSRGGSRFTTVKAETRSVTTLEPFATQSRSNRRDNSATIRNTSTASRQIKSGDAIGRQTTSEKSTTGQLTNSIRRRGGSNRRHNSEPPADLARAATGDRRYLPEPSAKKKIQQIDDDLNLQVPHESSARTNNRQSSASFRSRSVDRPAERRIDAIGPLSTFDSDVPRSRTGRKIQPTLSARDSRTFNRHSTDSSINASGNIQRSTESNEQSHLTSKRPFRRITERSTQKHGAPSSNPDEMNGNNDFHHETTTNYSTERNYLPRSKIIADNSNSEKSHTRSSSRNNRQGSIKSTDDVKSNRKKLTDHSGLKSESPEIKSGIQKNGIQSRNHGRNLESQELLRSSIDTKRRIQKNSRINEKSVRTRELNDNSSGQLRSRSRVAATLSKTPTESQINRHLSTTRTPLITEINTERIVESNPILEIDKSTTNVPLSISTTPIIPSLTPRSSVASSNHRRAAASSLSIKTLPKEDYFNHGLGFRGRKFNGNASKVSSTTPDTKNNDERQKTPILQGNPGWTLHRRPAFKKDEIPDASLTTSTISNEIPSTNEGKISLPNDSRRRGSKIFDKASLIVKIDREVGESDNYPPEFKAKIAKLKNPGMKDEGSKSSSISKDDDDDDPMRHVIVINRRQLRSTDNGKQGDTESHNNPEVISINPITTVPDQPDNLEMFDSQTKKNFQGRNKFSLDSNDSTRSREKSTTKRKSFKSHSSTSASSVANDNPSTTTVTAIGSQLDVTEVSPSLINTDKLTELKSSRASKRKNAHSRTLTTTPKSISTVTSLVIDRKLAKTTTSVERGSVRVGETSRLRQNRKDMIKTTKASITTSNSSENYDTISSTAIYTEELTTEKSKIQSVNSGILSSRGRKPTNNSLSTTTRRSRVWYAPYIDKNWEEPTRKSIIHDKLSTTTTVKSNIDEINKYSKKKLSDFKLNHSTLSTTTTTTTETSASSSSLPRRRDFRPRTATYRRHSEISSVAKIQEQNRDKISSVAITPRYHSSIKSENSTQRSVRQEPLLALQISNVTVNNSTNSTGISLSNRGKSGNSDSNIFNPTKATFLINSNMSLLEQLRNTVAPLLSTLGTKTPIFSGVYSNVNNANSNEQRVTPSGSPPRFSARYRGAELLVRKPNAIDSSGLSQTTPLIPTKNENISSSVSVSSPGEPKIITFYQALETASITNELAQIDSNTKQQQQQQSTGGQVDTNIVVNDLNLNGSTNANNDTTITIAKTLTDLEPVTNTVNKLIMIMNSQTPDPAITQSSDLTKTPEISTSTPETIGVIQSSMNLQSINNSSANVVSNPQIIMETIQTTTDTSNIISTTDITLSMSTNNLLVTKQEIKAIMDNLTESTINEVTSSAVESTTPFEFTTIEPENATLASTTFGLNTDNVTEQVTEMSLETSTITDETTASDVTLMSTESTATIVNLRVIPDEDISGTTEGLQNLAQFGNGTTSQVMQEDADGTTELSINEIIDTDNDQVFVNSSDEMTMASISSSSDLNSTEMDSENVTEAPELIDDAILTQMMKRLMDLFSLNDELSPLSKNISKVDDLGRMLGGFLDNSDRNISDDTTTILIPQENSTQEFNKLATTTQLPQDNITSMQNLSTEKQNAIVSTTEITIQTDAPLNDTSPNSETIQTIDQSLNSKVTTLSNESDSELTKMFGENLISQLLNTTTFAPITTPIESETIMTTTVSTSSITTTMNSQIDTTIITNDTNIKINNITMATAPTLSSQMIETTVPNAEMIDSSINPTTIRADESEILTNSSTIIPIPLTIPTTNDPNSIAGFQDTTPSTAQRTAGSDVTTQSSSSIISPSSTSQLTTTTPSSTTVNATTVTQSSLSPLLSSLSTSPSSMSTIKMTNVSETTGTSAETTQVTSTNAPTTVSLQTMPSTTLSSSTMAYLGRFGGSRITPAPRFSSSSSTRMPLRDYHIYGIYPNKTIVRKRPEDNLIDARNVDSPYVIFGIYPDGKLVRKFPNGTVIPDPPTNPVEVVFSLSTTTTTNRPKFFQQYNTVDQATVNNINNRNNINNNINKNFGRINNSPADIIYNDGENNGYRSQLNIGLFGNSLNPNGDGSNQFAVPTLMPSIDNVGPQSATTTMVTNTNSMPLQTSGPPSGATPSSVNPQGGRIIQDIERDKASRTKEAGGQRSTVYIGQEKFINYWSDNAAENKSQVLNVKINSITNAQNVGPNSGASPTFNIMTNNEDQSRVTAPPGFPWKDPLDQIFGITTNSPIGPSVASNTLDDPSPSRSAITDRTINPIVEVFTPMLNGAQLVGDTSSTTSATTNVPSTPSTTIQMTSTTTTTTPPATTTTTTTTTNRPTTITIMTTAGITQMPSSHTTLSPTQTTIPTTISTLSPFKAGNAPQQTAFGSTFDDLAFLNSLLQANQYSNSISSTPKTLTEVEQLLANKILSLALSKPGPTRSPKAIQSSNISPNSLDAFTSFGNSPPIIIDLLKSTTMKPVTTASTISTPYTWRPIPISSTASTIVYNKPSTIDSTTKNPEIITKPSTTSTSTTEFSTSSTALPTSTTTTTTSTSTTTTTTVQPTWDSFPTHPPTTNKPQVITSTIQTTQKSLNIKPVTAKPTRKPRPITTTQRPLGFGAGLLQAIFGRNIFAPPTTTTRKPLLNNRQPALNTKKIIQTTSKPILTTASANKITTVKSTSTFSPEDDAKFLLELLNAANKNVAKGDGVKGGNLDISMDDEKFLRAILSGEAKVRTPAPSLVSGGTTVSNAALLAELLKSEGIEPTTPINHLREQLQASGMIKSTRPTDLPRIVQTTPKKLKATRPKPSNWSPSSTYPSPLFSNFNFGFPRGGINSEETPNDSGTTRNQIMNAAIGATRLFSQFLGSAISGAAQQLQSFVRNGTRYVSEVVG
ncbi:hypothetical protein PV327_004671 [Microctonus hyperodae]|uniref:Uncharacterized protein n=1 Tax=Microctonus hyperodae TaxID=165561 RepID=A0AA39KMY2_MICHY|nr:hypothetical protein PV327_004671 [Microctonus hyperodae]